MTRLEKFKSYHSHPVQMKLILRLSRSEYEDCVRFIIDNEALNRNDFIQKVNRWYLDQPRPRHYADMWALVLQCGSEEQ